MKCPLQKYYMCGFPYSYSQNLTKQMQKQKQNKKKRRKTTIALKTKPAKEDSLRNQHSTQRHKQCK